MKKILVTILTIGLAFGFSGCSDSKPSQERLASAVQYLGFHGSISDEEASCIAGVMLDHDLSTEYLNDMISAPSSAYPQQSDIPTLQSPEYQKQVMLCIDDLEKRGQPPIEELFPEDEPTPTPETLETEPPVATE